MQPRLGHGCLTLCLCLLWAEMPGSMGKDTRHHLTPVWKSPVAELLSLGWPPMWPWADGFPFHFLRATLVTA